MKPLLPLSDGLPPSGLRNEQGPRDKHRKKFPAKMGRKTVKTTQEIVAAVMNADLDPKQAAEIAKTTETDIVAIRATIRKARATLQSRAEMYVDIHQAAAIRAANLGDAKPAQWALERIAEGKDRVVDPPTPAGPTAPPPTLNVGILLGGLAGPQLLPPTPPQAVDGETL